ncbi:MAG: DinB family protein [Phycisphaerales bacterium]|nr:DinB family protein [Phycisphaerales bacterium]
MSNQPMQATESKLDQICPKPSMRKIRDLDHATLCSRMHLGLECFDPRVVELDNDQVSQAWLDDANVGTWPIRVLIGHLADAEVVLAHRIRKIIAEDRPTIHLWDEHAFIDGGIYGCTEGSNLLPPMGGDLAMIHTSRAWLVALLMQLDDEQWNREGLHPTNGPMSARTIANYHCWHLEHHAWYLNAKIEKLVGPMPEPEPCSDQGCGKASCGCKGG